MKHLLGLAALFIALVFAAHGAGEEEAADVKTAEKTGQTDAAAKARFGPHEVEVELRDGSKLRGELMGNVSFILETSFGTLKIPGEDMINLRRGSGQSVPVDGLGLAAAVKDLGSDDPAKRAAAQQLLESDGKNSLDPLFDARAKAAGETKTRIDNLLKKLLSRDTAAAAADDTVQALKMKARGTLKTAAITLRSKLGELNLKLSDINALRWMCRGEQKTLELDAETGLREWTDTGVDTVTGEPMVIACTGQINLFGNFVGSPSGCTNWGNRPFLAGAVIGRLGEGEPFLIGPGKSWTPESNQRLYVKIFCNENMGQGNQSSGQFKLTISTGSLAGEKSPE